MRTIEDIKKELRSMIELAEKATPGPWNFTGSDKHHEPNFAYAKVRGTKIGKRWQIADVRFVETAEYSEQKEAEQIANFIARSRSMTSFACKALLMAIETLEKNVRWTEEGQAWWDGSSLTLNEIIKLWEEQK